MPLTHPEIGSVQRKRCGFNQENSIRPHFFHAVKISKERIGVNLPPKHPLEAFVVEIAILPWPPMVWADCDWEANAAKGWESLADWDGGMDAGSILRRIY